MRTEAEFIAADKYWRTQLAGKSLVIEASANPEEATLAFKILGANYRRADSRRQREDLLRRYAGAYLVGVCSVAFRYDEGAMWPHLEKEFGLLAQADYTILSDAFRDGLDRFGLSRFTFPRRNVDEILMHAGIPGQRMDEFLELLARRDAFTDGLDGRQFCQWIGGMSLKTVAANYALDAPTYRFLASGREIAEDLVDRCLDLLARWATSPDTVDVEDFPGVMRPDLLRALEEVGEKDVQRRWSPRAKQVDLNPKLVFDPGVGVIVRLPPLETVTETQIEWKLSSEGTTSRLMVNPPWPGDPVAPAALRVHRPVKQVAVSATPGDNLWVLGVIDPDDPLIAFDPSSGEWIPPMNTLPGDQVWLALPNENGVPLAELLEVVGTLGAPKEFDAPMGWSGWTFASLSVKDAAKLRLVGGDAWRYVSSASRPTVEAGVTLDYVTTAEGAAVHVGPLSATIPAVVPLGEDGVLPEVPWRVSVTRLSDGEVVSSEVLVSTDVPRVVRLGSDTDNRLLGAFEVSVRGPLGRGITRRVHLAEGFDIRSDVTFRRMTTSGSGLEPASVTIMDSMTEAAPQVSLLGRHQQFLSVTLGAADGTPTLPGILRVPAMSVVELSAALDPLPSHAPVQIDLERLDRARLRVSTGVTGRVSLVAMHKGEVLQSVSAMATGATGTAVFPLSQLSDTLTGERSGAALLLGVEGDRIPVANIRPRSLAGGAVVRDGELQLENLTYDQPLEVAGYRRYAPWLGPEVFRTDGSSVVALPAALDGERNVRVVLRVRDPWVSYRWPRSYPVRAENVFDVKLGEFTDDRGGIDEGFRSWLRGVAPCAVTRESLPLAVDLYMGTDLGVFSRRSDVLRSELGSALASVGEFLPAIFPELEVRESPIDLFVDADIVTLPPGSYSHAENLWDASPLLAVLSVSDMSDVATRDTMERILGDDARSILDEGIDPHANIGRFDGNAEVMHRWPRERVDAVWRSANPIPARLLDTDTRSIASKQMFDLRTRMPSPVSELTGAFGLARNALARSIPHFDAQPIERRLAEAGWPSLPAMTIAFSLAARAAARGIEGMPALYSLVKPFFVALARLSPKLVEQDLILAELWLTRWDTLAPPPVYTPADRGSTP